MRNKMMAAVCLANPSLFKLCSFSVLPISCSLRLFCAAHQVCACRRLFTGYTIVLQVHVAAGGECTITFLSVQNSRGLSLNGLEWWTHKILYDYCSESFYHWSD